MNEHYIPWIAGLFEGEGCISFHTKNNGVQLALVSTDKDIIERFHREIGVGSIYHLERPQHGHGTKPQWRWYVGNADEVEKILTELMPWFGERRTAKAQEALDRLTHIRRKGFCKRNHKLEGDNLYVSPKGQRHCRECARLRREITSFGTSSEC